MNYGTWLEEVTKGGNVTSAGWQVTLCKVKKSKSKRSIAVSDSPHRYGNSHAIWDHTVLPATRRGDIPALAPAEAGTRLSDPGGMQG